MNDYVDYDSDYDGRADTSRGVTDVDPYAGTCLPFIPDYEAFTFPPIGIFFSKDRREEVIEVEEDPEIVMIPGTNQTIKTMTQGQWMKGCPEGGEQGFLFSLYDELSSGSYPCPECKHRFQRRKGDFFALHVSRLWCDLVRSIDPSSSTNSQITSKVFVSSCGSIVHNVRGRSVMRVGNPYQQTKRIGQTQRLTTTPFSTVLTCRASSSVWDFSCSSNSMSSST